jgi:predicted XRE-type DNA-binding protein
MSGHKSFDVLRDQIDADPERRERVEQLHRAYDVVLGLADLRESRGLTQARLADEMRVSQPNVSKVEGKEDIRLSTLRHYVEALGGQLEVRAVFEDHPEQSVNIVLPGDTGGQAASKR